MLVVDFENKKIVADNHVVETYRTCEEKYRLMLHENWVPAGRASELAFGIAMHAGRAKFKKLVMQHGWVNTQTAIDEAVRVGLEVWEKEQNNEMKTEVMIDDKRGATNYARLLRGYLAKYGDPVEYKPVRVEVPGQRLLGTTPDGWEMHYVYTIDEVVEHKGKVWPVEFKTASGFGPPDDRWFAQFNNKASVTGYVWATEQELGTDVGGAIIHGMWVHAEPKSTSRSKYTLPDYFKMDYSYRNDEQIAEWKKNTLLTGDDIVRSVEKNRWKRADGLACNVFNGCAMKKICQATPGVRDKLLEMDYVKWEWNPWARLED
jgi:hypothetical protein